MSFDFAAAIARRPSGATRAALVAAYGDPTKGSVRTGKGQFTPSPEFASHIVGIPTATLPGFPPFGEQTVGMIRLHEQVAVAFEATWAELDRRGLTGRLRTYSGATVYRHMLWDYDRPVSLHAYGVAIDFDAAWNGYGIPAAQMQMDPEFVRCMEECGWHWGGRWNPTDGMHFQWTDPLPGVPVPEWQDALARPVPEPESGAVVTVRDLRGELVPAPGKHFVYNNTVVHIDGQLVTMERKI